MKDWRDGMFCNEVWGYWEVKKRGWKWFGNEDLGLKRVEIATSESMGWRKIQTLS